MWILQALADQHALILLLLTSTQDLAHAIAHTQCVHMMKLIVSSGRISLGVVRVYIQAMGGWLSFAFLAIGLLSTEAARVAGTVWLSYWTNSTNSEGKAPHGAFWYLGVYAAISGLQVRLHTPAAMLLTRFAAVPDAAPSQQVCRHACQMCAGPSCRGRHL